MRVLLNKNRAFTLIELLIVIAIATILATLTLTTMQGLLKDQKISQSVRLARQYIESARTRAMATGRPVALFLERSSPEGNSAGDPVEANYTVTRMSIGEVFPPYTGESPQATATLWDTPLSASTRGATDGFADQARFLLAEVITAFGTASTPGMMSIGDTIEFGGNNQRFVIESIDYVGGEVAVTFFNPPSTYDTLLAAKIIGGTATDQKFELGYSGREPTLKTPNTLAGMTAPTPPGTFTGVSFRVYRKPSKSLVGTVTMPRGTCIDLSVSGLGPSGSALETTSPFHLASAPSGTLTSFGSSPTMKRSSYSRIAVVFSAEGRAQGMYQDNRIINMTGTPEVVAAGSYVPFPLASKLFLMVGRTEQVLPSSPLTAPVAGEREDARGNLMDTGNTWISINPFTGLIETSPVAAVTSTSSIPVAVQQARRFAAMGVNDGGR